MIQIFLRLVVYERSPYRSADAARRYDEPKNARRSATFADCRWSLGVPVAIVANHRPGSFPAR